MRVLFKAAAATATSVVLLSACGGGGDSPPPPPTPTPSPAPTPPPPAPAPAPAPSPTPTPAPVQINSSTYLNAYWLGWVAVTRLEALANMVNFWSNAVDESSDQAFTNAPCPSGGTASMTASGTQPTRSRSIILSNCNIGIAVLNGTVSSPNAVFATSLTNGALILSSGSFTFSGFSYRLSIDTVTESIADTSTLQVQANLLANPAYYAGTGSISFVRNGKTDAYTNIQVQSTPENSAGSVSLITGTLTLSTPRFSQSLSIGGDSAFLQISARAPDGSTVVGTENTPRTSPPNRTYRVVNSPGGATVLTQTLADNDTAVQAAIANATN